MKEGTDKSGKLNAGPVVLYDGVCALCNWAVRFILERDPEARYRFAPLHSAAAQSILGKISRSGDLPDSVVLVEEGEIYVRSVAAFRVLAQLQTAWRVLLVFRVLPKWVSDSVYDLIARTRYRVFGRYDSCPIPTADQRSRFLDGSFS